MKKLLPVLVLVCAMPCNAQDNSNRKVRFDLSWDSSADASGIQNADRSLNSGEDAFWMFCDHAVRLVGRGKRGCSGGTSENQADYWLYDLKTLHPSGETFDLFAGRTTSLRDSGTAFSARLRVPVGKRWDAVIGFRQGRTRTLREDAFRDYARLNTQEPTLWFYDWDYFFGGGWHTRDWFLLSRHYREESTTVTYRSRTLGLGGEYTVLARGRLNAAVAGGTDIRLDRSDGERTVRDYDYKVFLPEHRHNFGGPVQDPKDWRVPASEPVTERRSATDIQLLPYVGVSTDVRVFRNLSLASQARWYPTVQETVRSQESILGPYDVNSRPRRFSFSLGASYAF